MVQVVHASDPVVQLEPELLLMGPLVNVEETPVQVLKEHGRADTTQSCMWVFRGGGSGQACRLLPLCSHPFPCARCEDDHRALFPQSLTPDLLVPFMTTV